MFKALKPQEWMILIFSNVFVSYQICTIPSGKMERILTLMIIRANRLELMKIVYIANFNTFGSNMFLTVKIMDFENVTSTKVVHIYVKEAMNA
jgi:hypothetical protein